MLYPIVEVPIDAAALVEQVGTKPKFWYDDDRRLFKEGRPGTGENWAEIVACRLCDLLSLPHARYDFAICGDRQGVVTENFVSAARLVLGNELLLTFNHGYDGTKRYRQTQYSLQRVRRVLTNHKAPNSWDRPDAIGGAIDVFVGYLMFDAWIANQDRHHENWGLLLPERGEVCLAPTFDHAAGFGRAEPDERRTERLTTRDQGFSVAAYAERARSPFYPTSGSGGPISTVDAFNELAQHRPAARRYWLDMLSQVIPAQVEEIFAQVPTELISRPAIDFAIALLKINRSRLLSCS